ncbi:ESCRT-II complex subunit-domain-containing protein [Microdochium trichocladiopsis]|uniref:Vacuolar protein-sorting-associated protein 25 n=1 Tax=Microdochium trichocladiopsis TaxID=1682393 RepID=A0A9P9BVJ8_9PEZI|nr:ESCRT-II complex subunit-domain-containing protein [Microdochium trichocladiopsis]KAH7040348.1 ESCRT-II complex subunit-domain-containing protein [Microdochium trichocladiopsis]
MATTATSTLGVNTVEGSSSSSSTFNFPREYNFPPFFTRQTNLATLHSQRETWSSFVLDYCRHHRIFRLSLSNAIGGSGSELFHNKRLDRRLSLADARDVLEHMRKEGRAEPASSSSSSSSSTNASATGGGDAGDVWWIYWRTPEEWAAMIESYVDETAQRGTVLTLYELVEGEGTRGRDFYGLHPELLQKALQTLVKRGKAQIFGHEDSQGVKFF